MLPDSTPPCPACGEPNAATPAWQLVDEEGRELLRCGCGHVFAVEPAQNLSVKEVIDRARTAQLAFRLEYQLHEDLHREFEQLKRRFRHGRGRGITPPAD
ncbi:MAG TPA: hypothetical protein VFB80_02160 [Pirellulaceae bacterium]|nr:hypothetical protein [Pirellulaceae bacterium]